ncbi:purple acid phosphatase 24 [Striga asiatica]|uniref:Purple acid phosphatase 24 n=1 Tax=Striga asiatica TaxID=4170 RepID=A0A5A7PFJ9_STRAF|nr:purple acid phosphatase 24 [Striga asiatica]
MRSDWAFGGAGVADDLAEDLGLVEEDTLALLSKKGEHVEREGYDPHHGCPRQHRELDSRLVNLKLESSFYSLLDSIAIIVKATIDLVGWSENITFKTPPFAGANELKFIAYGDMGKAPLDASIEHFMQPGSVSVVKAMADDVSSGLVDSIFHIGDISYATGFLVEWDYFLSLISTLASRVPYMTSIGNHERNYMDSASLYKTTDSGGECGVPYETYFPMPTPGKDRPWHRPMYTTNERYTGLHNVDHKFIDAVEPLLLQNKVDLALFGHVHNYERTCAIYQKMCLSMPTKEGNGIDTYDNTNYSAPVHAIIGMAGFTLDEFPTDRNYNWSLSRIAQFGYIRAHATRNELKVEFVNADTKEVGDSFRIIKN